MIRGYCDAFALAIADAELRAEAIEWSPDPRRPLGPRRLAVRHRPRRPSRGAAGLTVGQCGGASLPCWACRRRRATMLSPSTSAEKAIAE